MPPTADEEPLGAGLIRSAPLTPADEQELAAFIAASKQRNAALIARVQAQCPPNGLPHALPLDPA